MDQSFETIFKLLFPKKKAYICYLNPNTFSLFPKFVNMVSMYVLNVHAIIKIDDRI